MGQQETITAAEYKRRLTKGKTKGKARHKFKATTTERDGLRFDSELEAKYYDHLVRLQQQGAIVGFLPQPVFHLGGGVKYRADFQVFHIDGSCQFVDVKGFVTKAFKKNMRLVAARYPWLTVDIITKDDFPT